jgi:hypothetical protein
MADEAAEGSSSAERAPIGLRRGVVRPQIHKPRVAPPDLTTTSATGSFAGFFYRGGPVINTPQAYLVFLGDWSSAASHTRATRLTQFVSDLFASRYMNILSQYGCGTSGAVINSVLIPSTDTDLSGADINGVLQSAIDDNQIPEPTDARNIYILVLDDATAVNDGDIVMCEATSDTAFGFHFFFTTTAGNTCVFAVIPGLTDACLTNSCPTDSSCSLHTAQTQEQRQTQVMSHEISEMISDPKLDAWTDLTNGENGDICNGQSDTVTVGANTWTVQKMYSKWHDMTTSGATTCIVDCDPLPSLLPACSVMLDRSQFGKDEIDALLHLSNPGSIEAAFYVAVDGFTPGDLGITAAMLSGTPAVAPTMTFTPAVVGVQAQATALVAEDPALGGGIQRFTWEFRITFTSSGAFPTTLGGDLPVTLTASSSRIAAPAVTATGSAVIHFIHEPNPYEQDGATSWLSTDLRVFQLHAGDTRFGATMGGAAADAPAFIQQVIANLNSGATGGQHFEDISTNEDSSPLELSEQVGGAFVFNFALAKVRYRALSTDVSGVRAFFRLFPVSTTSTDYNQATSYRRAGSASSAIPLPGVQGGEIHSIPCFAAPRVDSATQSLTAQTDPPNVRSIAHDGSGNEVVAFFGCWLDINQPFEPQFPIVPSPVDGPFGSGRQSIQQLVRGAHQCLIAEIAFDPDPIPTGATPGSSDKLAQRNLAIVASDNPGGPASHMIPGPFEVRHTSSSAANAQPDERLIDWRVLPAGSTARLYIPGADANEIVRRADALYVSHHLTAIDQRTIGCAASGLTYLPVPSGTGANLPGLLTVDLPEGVRRGQLFKVVVRQVTSRAGERPTPPPPPPQIGTPAAGKRAVIRWRQVLGSFQVSIPVSTRTVILAPEERLLAVLRWIELSIPPANRWFLVFERYIEQVADRVRALGGDPDTIKPSPSGGEVGHGHADPHATGKVSEVIFDCFGDLEGFALDTCEHIRHFRSNERRLAELLLELCEERMTVTVISDPARPHQVERIIVRP